MGKNTAMSQEQALRIFQGCDQVTKKIPFSKIFGTFYVSKKFSLINISHLRLEEAKWALRSSKSLQTESHLPKHQLDATRYQGWEQHWHGRDRQVGQWQHLPPKPMHDTFKTKIMQFEILDKVEARIDVINAASKILINNASLRRFVI